MKKKSFTIALFPGDGIGREVCEAAAAVLEKAAAGTDFAALAMKYSDSASASDGGYIHELARNMSVPPFDRAAFSLKPGEISTVIATPAGYQIIKRIR